MTKGIAMELRDYIEQGVKKFKTITALAEELGLERPSLSAAKAHQRGLPAYAIVKLSAILDLDPRVIMAASELVTERKEEKRAFWLPFVKNAQLGRIAGLTLILATVTNLMTPSPAEAAPLQAFATGILCIMLSHKYFSCLQGIFKNNFVFGQIMMKTSGCRLGMAP
jgi:plasmid maintenance system antidote protein VapI